MPPKGSPGSPKIELLVPRLELEARLLQRIDMGAEIIKSARATPERLDEARRRFYTWDEYNAELLGMAFSTPALRDQYSQTAGVWAVGAELSLDELLNDFASDVQHKIRMLRSVADRLELFDRPAPSVGAAPATVSGELFLVHGHDGTLREAVARFCSRVLRSEPVILHEQPNRGQTVIEKLERHGGQAGYAVILLTGDDEGQERGGSDPKPRARQNVVLEFGFFMGSLGRGRTAVLYEPGVELPSDLAGLVYIEADSPGAWRLKLAGELKAAGFDVDMNALL